MSWLRGWQKMMTEAKSTGSTCWSSNRTREKVTDPDGQDPYSTD
jgi:hypothetical protein